MGSLGGPGQKKGRGGLCQRAKLDPKTIRKPNDIANGLEKLQNLRHCSQNLFSHKTKYKLQYFSRIAFLFINLANAIRPNKTEKKKKKKNYTNTIPQNNIKL